MTVAGIMRRHLVNLVISPFYFTRMVQGKENGVQSERPRIHVLPDAL